MTSRRSDTEIPSRLTSRAGSPPRYLNGNANGQHQHRHHKRKQNPQQSIEEFWSRFTSKAPGKAFTILPDNLYARRLAQRHDADEGTYNAFYSYEEAARMCKEKVEKIVRECKRVNQKYRDLHFDIEADFQLAQNGNVPECLTTLETDHCHLRPKSVKRVEDIFHRPHFFIKGATANDVRQGKEGDCWLMSAVSTLSNCDGLIERVCVARDEKVGVYGFVFHRDGAWISEVIDDKLYLTKEDFHESTLERERWLEIQNRKNPEEEYRRQMQTGSKALYFAQCSDPNETWLPLLEKAYAKSHGDFMAIEGGFVGEGIEDLTGGVTSEVFATDILDKDAFWRDEIMQVNKSFLFGCAQGGGRTGSRRGVIERHAYSIMEAREIDGKRLVKLRNPWGNTEWQGDWSDGSPQWTRDWMDKLNHSFGNDGLFWISYRDLLRVYQHFDRTRLFDNSWQVTQQWTSLSIPWSVDYHDTRFSFTIARAGPVVITLSQLDDRYFRGLQGQYLFKLQFRLHKDGESDYLVRSPSSYYMRRSVSTEVNLEPGSYTVMLKIVASRYDDLRPTEEIIRKNCKKRRDKLLAMGLSYDLAHAKGQFKESEKEKKERETRERREKRKANAKAAHQAARQARLKQKYKDLRRKQKFEAKRLKAAITSNGRRTPSDDGDLSDASDDERPPAFNAPRYNPRRASEGLGIITPAPTPAAMASRFAHAHQRSDTTNSLPLPSRNRPRRSDSQPPNLQVNGSPLGRRLSVADMSDDALSWDTELDAPPDTDDEFVDPEYADYVNGHPHGLHRGDTSDEEDDEFTADPWNAVCVVGLRLHTKNNQVNIRVVKPDESNSKEHLEKVLDLDDSAIDHTKLGKTPAIGFIPATPIGAEPESIEYSRQG